MHLFRTSAASILSVALVVRDSACSPVQWVRRYRRLRPTNPLLHAREPLHTHRWPSVMYGERYGAGRYYDATGWVMHEFTKLPQAGASNPHARWQEPEGPHSVENTGNEADRFIRVEYRQ
jgi:hypothetical protein